MPNHVHVVFRHLWDYDTEQPDEELYPITDIFGKLKRHTAREANKLLSRTGKFWQNETYDHVIRTAAELHNTIVYTLNNPVAANLVTQWREWPYNYCKPEWESGL